MLPHKLPRGEEALSRLKTFEGIPPPYDKEKRLVVPSALKVLRLKPRRKVCGTIKPIFQKFPFVQILNVSFKLSGVNDVTNYNLHCLIFCDYNNNLRHSSVLFLKFDKNIFM